jgi:hypothetical protein
MSSAVASDKLPTVGFVTVSYGPDRDRCALLCKSLDAFAPGAAGHWVIVERADVKAFKDLESPFRRLLVTEEVVPSRLLRVAARRLGLRTNIFLTRRGKPIRGWLLQQLAKLAICREVQCDVVVHADSDVALVRPFRLSDVVDASGRVRLYCVPGRVDSAMSEHVQWHRTAEQLLGLPTAPTPLPEFITHLVPWRRENAVALLDYLDDRGTPWVRALANAWSVAEYVLYGRFVTEVLRDSGQQFLSTSSLCRDYWDTEVLSRQEIEALLDSMSPDELGISLTAKAGIPAATYAQLIESLWRSNGS